MAPNLAVLVFMVSISKINILSVRSLSREVTNFIASSAWIQPVMPAAAAARYIPQGQPRPPAPMISTAVFFSLSGLAVSKILRALSRPHHSFFYLMLYDLTQRLYQGFHILLRCQMTKAYPPRGQRPLAVVGDRHDRS